MNQIDEIRKRRRRTQPIPCSERLPEESGEYLGWTHRWGWGVVRWNAQGWFRHGVAVSDVVYWQPLPADPEATP